MPDLELADISEFQGDIDMGAYSAGHPAIILRAHNGTRPDYKWDRNIAAATADPNIRWIGAYQYLPQAADPTAAARKFKATLGTFRPNCTILDLEEGSGDQQPRQHAWLAEMASDPSVDWTYSGSYFARCHNLDDVQWIAAYQQRTPTEAHQLWQFTDAQNFPGIGSCDGSVFLGTVDQLIALTGNTSNTPVPDPEDDDMPGIQFQLPDGTIVVAPKNGEKPWAVPGAGASAFHLLVGNTVGEGVLKVSDPAEAQALLALTK